VGCSKLRSDFSRTDGAVYIEKVGPQSKPNCGRDASPNIIALAAERNLPVMYEGREFVEDGGLISYGPDIVEMTRRSATFVDKISKGADPANLPIEQPRRFELKHEAFKVYWPQPAPDFARPCR
jgi:hypothetical protein